MIKRFDKNGWRKTLVPKLLQISLPYLEGIHNKNHWPKMLHLNAKLDWLQYPTTYFFSRPCGKLKTKFPDFPLTLTRTDIFPDFFQNSMTFPWPWQPWKRNTGVLQWNKGIPYLLEQAPDLGQKCYKPNYEKAP